MLELLNIKKQFNQTFESKMVFHDFSFKVNKGDFITIIGSNGAGKSTLLNIISGDLISDNGTILFNQEDITYMKEYIRAKRISRVFQNPILGTSPSLTVLENIMMALHKNSSYGLKWAIQKKKMAEVKDFVKQLNIGLEAHLNTPVSHLSGGQRQALSLLMATINQPELLLLDEHTAALDPNASKEILEITKKLVNFSNITTLMVTHNMEDAVSFGNRLVMMDQGQVILDLNNEEKSNITKEELILKFKQLKTDRLILS